MGKERCQNAFYRDLATASDSAASTEVHFSPGTTCLEAIVKRLRGVRTALDICVFTITDDRISREIIAAHERRVAVRVLSDNDKAFDGGSDVDRLERAGVAVVVDHTDNHMHHKFAIFDGRAVLTGSYNWTRSAAVGNHENILITTDSAAVQT